MQVTNHRQSSDKAATNQWQSRDKAGTKQGHAKKPANDKQVNQEDAWEKRWNHKHAWHKPRTKQGQARDKPVTKQWQASNQQMAKQKAMNMHIFHGFLVFSYLWLLQDFGYLFWLSKCIFWKFARIPFCILWMSCFFCTCDCCRILVIFSGCQSVIFENSREFPLVFYVWILGFFCNWYCSGFLHFWIFEI